MLCCVADEDAASPDRFEKMYQQRSRASKPELPKRSSAGLEPGEKELLTLP